MNTTAVFFTNSHLTEEGVALYVDALKLNRLSAMPEEIMEHVEQCERCKAMITELDAAMPQSLYDGMTTHPYFDRRVVREPEVEFSHTWYRLAAAVAGAAILGAGYYFIASHDTPTQSTAAVPATAVSPAPASTSSGGDGEMKSAQKDDELLAANFEPSPNLEDLVSNEFRSTSISAVSPVVGKVTSQPITFRWKNADQTVMLKVLNNRENVVASASVQGSSWTMRQTLTRGLYYWKLESEDELLYVGKFIVK